ncbi:MAG: hypothetical protein H6555_03455 [Lewinellaceae bacterium]|nr:hypothetical protein [Lewinellaceae bacterium]
MKRLLLSAIFLCLGFWGWAQLNQQLTDINQLRLGKQKRAMLVLGGWALSNMAVGTVLASQREGVARHFHTMNAGWNVINLGIAAAGYWSASKADPGAYDLFATIQEQNSLQKILLFNAGLDVGYMLGGAYLIERSKNTVKNPERLEGFGKSIVLQGAFLFVFDLANFAIFSADNTQLKPLLSGLPGGGTAMGLQWSF